MKKYWPVPDSYDKFVPTKDFRAFGAKRSESSRHTGIDVYAPLGSKVIAVEDGKAVRISQFTGYPESPRWRKTHCVMVQNVSGSVVLYGEIRKPRLRIG